MARRFWMIVLAIGATLGFASGFHSLYWHAGAHGLHGRWYGRGGHQELEEHVADICARSAERVFRERGAAGAKPAPAP